MDHNVYVSGGFKDHLLELVAVKVAARPGDITIDIDSSTTGRGFEVIVTQYVHAGTDHARAVQDVYDSFTSFMRWLQEDEIDEL